MKKLLSILLCLALLLSLSACSELFPAFRHHDEPVDAEAAEYALSLTLREGGAAASDPD